METAFTPVHSLIGGAWIGIASVLLMLTLGRIMGATGIVAGILAPTGRSDLAWRLALLAGMATGPLAVMALTGTWPEVQVPTSRTVLVIGGVLVGIGVTFGAGCTSGHGVCGLARLSPRSLVATLTFMLTTGITVPRSPPSSTRRPTPSATWSRTRLERLRHRRFRHGHRLRRRPHHLRRCRPPHRRHRASRASSSSG
jgi:uncharacterized membrane protein YedE/YeeE